MLGETIIKGGLAISPECKGVDFFCQRKTSLFWFN